MWETVAGSPVAPAKSARWFTFVGEGDLRHLSGPSDGSGLRELAAEPVLGDTPTDTRGMWLALVQLEPAARSRLLLEHQQLLGVEARQVLGTLARDDERFRDLMDQVRAFRRTLKAMADVPQVIASIGPIARYVVRVEAGLLALSTAEEELARLGERGADVLYVDAVAALVSVASRSADFGGSYRLARLLHAFAHDAGDLAELRSLSAFWSASAAALQHRYDDEIDVLGWAALQEWLGSFQASGIGYRYDAGAVSRACRAAAFFVNASCTPAHGGVARRRRSAPVVDGLMLAQTLLLTSERVAPDDRRDQTLYQLAIVQRTLVDRRRCDPVTAIGTATRALAVLDPAAKAVARVTLARDRWQLGGPRPDFTDLIASADEIRERVSVAFAWEAVHQAARLAAETNDPDAARRLTAEAVTYARDHCPHRLGEAYHDWLHAADEGLVDCGVRVGVGYPALPDLKQLTPDRAAAVLAHMSLHCASPEIACELAAAAVGAPQQIPRVGRYAQLGEFGARARRLVGGTPTWDDARVWRWGQALLETAHKLAAEAPDTAAKRACTAVNQLVQVGTITDAIEATKLLVEVMPDCRQDTAMLVLQQLQPSAPRLVEALTPDGLDLWASLGQAIDATMQQWEAWAGLLHHRLFKGLSLEAMLTSPPQITAEAGQRMMALVDDFPADESVARAPRHEAEAAICSVLEPAERYSGRTAAQARLNAWRSYDAEVQRVSMVDSLERLGGDELEPVLPIADPDTVVISYFLGLSARDRLAETLMAFYGETMTVTKLLQPQVENRDIRLRGDHGRGWRIRPEGLDIVNLRDRLQADPGSLPATPVVQTLLERLAEIFVRPTANILLDQYAAGVRRLVIWPHGPTHFLPFGLLPIGGSRLADLFTVTTVPSLRALRPRPRTTTATIPLLVVACPTTGTDHGWPPVPQLEDQADAIAATVPESVRVPEAEATAERVLDLMAKARWVHLASHGDHVPHAPAFQSLYVAGAPLRAHQIWGRDLSAVDVITLSACESALGRVDVVDNLRGLTASLLVAGVGAVIAALWPVNTRPAETFYTAFYAAMTAGSRPVDAFGIAQRVTRSRWPQYRHWAAFTYIGGERT